MNNDDNITLGGLPAASLRARRARRESGEDILERPTQPIMYAASDETVIHDREPAPEMPPPARSRARYLADLLVSGSHRIGRSECEEMARFIQHMPDYVAVIDRVVAAELVAQRIVTGPTAEGDPSLRDALAELADAKHRLASLGSAESPIGDVVGAIQGLIDEWLLATVAVERARVRDGNASEPAIARMDHGERAVAEVSGLDRRFSGWLSWVLDALRNRRRAREPAVVQLDPPNGSNVTDAEILALARMFIANTGRDRQARQMCVIALGIGGPLTDAHGSVAMGMPIDGVISEARAWCATMIAERALASPHVAT